jgi:hypothetical protein
LIGRPAARAHKITAIKLLSVFLLVSGWALVPVSAALLGPAPVAAIFVLAGVAVEGLGLVLLFRAHFPAREDAP